MKLYGNGAAALVDDSAMAEQLGWPERKRSVPHPNVMLRATEGDPAREPWIARRRNWPGHALDGLWRRSPGGSVFTYLARAPGVARYLRAMAAPPREGGCTIGITGLGRVGGLAATLLACTEAARSRIELILLNDCDRANLERMRRELASVTRWRGKDGLPRVEAVDLPEMLGRADAVLFAAARGVPPLGTTGEVRLVQFQPNREALAGVLEAAAEAQFTGLFCVLSDPVDLLAQAAFHDSNCMLRVGSVSFLGTGLAPERVAGLALGVMWGRALAEVEDRDRAERVRLRGAVYGPHSTEVLAFDDVARPDPELSARMTEAARNGNYRIRDLGFLPYVGPAASSAFLTLIPLLAGREVLASHFMDGIYFGGPCRLDWGLVSSPHAMAAAARRQVRGLHGLVEGRMTHFGLIFPASVPPRETESGPAALPVA